MELRRRLGYNNNNSYSALPRKNLWARNTVRYQHQNPLDNQKSPSTINAYININMTKSQDETNKQKANKKKKHKYCKCVHYSLLWHWQWKGTLSDIHHCLEVVYYTQALHCNHCLEVIYYTQALHSMSQKLTAAVCIHWLACTYQFNIIDLKG